MLIIAAIFALLGIAALILSFIAFNHARVTKEQNPVRYLKLGSVGFLALTFIAALTLYIIPVYKVWQKGKEGEAALAEATANRQILIQEASAKEEAAKHLSEAEIIRSYGISKANSIVSESLKGNSMYLQYLYIMSLKESQNKVIYVPVTNQGLPLLESARLLDDGISINNLPQEKTEGE